MVIETGEKLKDELENWCGVDVDKVRRLLVDLRPTSIVDTEGKRVACTCDGNVFVPTSEVPGVVLERVCVGCGRLATITGSHTRSSE